MLGTSISSAPLTCQALFSVPLFRAVFRETTLAEQAKPMKYIRKTTFVPLFRSF
jgi:hypothetical protein